MFWQTMDNNRSRKNKMENLQLTQELIQRIDELMRFNEFKSKTILKNHIVDWAYTNQKVFVTDAQAKCSAEDAFLRYKSCGFIDEWNNIREDLIEYLT